MTPKEKKNQLNRQYYERTKAKLFAVRKQRLLEWRAFKATLSCTVCGESHPSALDFHHVIKENKQSVAKLISGYQYARARKEVTEKCIVLCANCHRKLHSEE